MADFTKEDLKEVMQEIFGGSGGAKTSGVPKYDAKNIAAFDRALKENLENVKKSVTFGKQFNQMLNQQTATYKDYKEELEAVDKQLQALSNAIAMGTAGATAQEQYRKTVEYKAELQKLHQINQARVGAQNFAVGMGKILEDLTKATWQYVKDAQGSSEGIEAGSALAVAAAESTSKSIGMVGELMTALGPIIGGLISSIGKFIPAIAKSADAAAKLGNVGKIAGFAISGIGVVVTALGSKMSTVTREGMEFLTRELITTTKVFKEVSQAGVIVAGGMTELRQIAAEAGMNVTMLGNVVKANKDDLAAMGLGMGEAVKRLAGVSGELRRSDIGVQLRNLGYNAEEQAGLVASLSANLAASGDTRVRSDKQVAEMTAQYGKDLKVLSDITGQDAKKKMEEARVQAMQQDLMAEAMRKGGPEAVQILQRQLAALPPAMKKGYMEFVSSGGEAITDVATNVMMQQNPKILEQYQAMFKTLGSGEMDASAAMDQTTKLTEQTAKFALENVELGREIAIGARLTGNSLLQSITDLNNQLIAQGTRMQEGITETSRAAAEKLATTTDPLTKSVSELNQAYDQFKAKLTEATTDSITTFSKSLKTAEGGVDAFLKKLGIEYKKEEKKEPESAKADQKMGETIGTTAGEYVGGAIGAALGGAVGAALGPMGAVVGGIAGNVLGSWLGGKAGKIFGKGVDNPQDISGATVSDTPMAAYGAVLSGPKTGYRAILHGTEAVVPLPDGRTIPVNLDFKNLERIVQDDSAANKDLMQQSISDNQKILASIEGLYAKLSQPMSQAESPVEPLLREQISMLLEIKGVLENSNSLQQQYVYNTYN